MGDGQTDRPTDGTAGPLRRSDQRIVALGALVGLATVAVWWAVHGGGRGDLVEIDRAAAYEVTFTLDINQAQWPEFAQLPRVGETLARRIVDERNRGGPFASVDDLEMRIWGIGPKTVQEIREHLRPTAENGRPPDDLPTEPRR